MRGDGVQSGQSGLVRQRRFGPVLLLGLRNPPVNALSAALRQALIAGLDGAYADEAVQAVLLTGDGRVFSAGTDLADLDKPPTLPLLADVCRRIEEGTKPVVAILRGTVSGAGLELALAAHYRLAEPQARLGFPEVTLGLVPGAGGTQRLARLVGAEQALRLLLSGRSVDAPEALAMGLVDQVLMSTVMARALRFASEIPALRPTLAGRAGMRDPLAYQAAVARARQSHSAPHPPAPGRAIECVEAALLLPTEQALAFERAAFDDLSGSPEAQALRHIFRAERRAAAVPAQVAAHPVPPLTHIGLWGAAGGSADLAGRALRAGLRVTLADPVRDTLAAGLRRIAEGAEAAMAAGRLTATARDADWARLTSLLTPDGLAGVDLVLVRPETGPLPDSLRGLAQIAVGGLSPDMATGVAVACHTGRKTPVEIAAGRAADPTRVALALALAGRLGGGVVFTGAGGPIAERLNGALASALDHLAQAGTPPATLHAVQAQFRPAPAVAPPATAAMRLCIAVLANAGAQMLREGCAHRPSDIDAVAVLSGLMPRWQGGPMHQADGRGLLLVRADLRAAGQGAPFPPDPLIDQLITEGRRFAALNVKR